MAFSDNALKVAAQSAVIAAHKNLAKISFFAKDFRELEGKKGQAIAVPVYDFTPAAAFSAQNNYGSGSNEIDGTVITLDQHLVKPTSISDVEEAETSINWLRDTETALADVITRGVNNYVFGLINTTNVTQTENYNPTDKSVIAALGALAAQYDIPVDRAVVALTATEYYKVLGLVGDASIYGGREAIVGGTVPGLYGFKAFVCADNLPTGVKGAIICDSAVGIVSRYLAPSTEGDYPEAWSVTTDEGFSIGYRRFMDRNMGETKFAADVLFGAKILQANKIVLLV